MVYIGTCDCYENIKRIIFNYHIKAMTHRNFLLQKESDCKVQLHFVKCCALVVTEGYHILLSPLNRLVTCHFSMSRMYIRTSWEHNQRKRKCSINGDGGSEPLRRRFRGLCPLRNFLGSKEYLDWLNDTGKTLFYSIQYKNLLKYKLGCSWPFSYIYTIN